MPVTRAIGVWMVSSLTLVASTLLSAGVVLAATPGSWSPSGALSTPRIGQSATLLPDGSVLLAGGENPTQIFLTSAELYNPSSGTWSTTRSMRAGHLSQTATLLPNGNVLIAGGLPLPAAAELYNPATASWSTTASLNETRSGATATLLRNGRVL